MDRLTASDAFSFVPNAQPVDNRGRYLHWDEMRHRRAPNGLSSELWWATTKLARFGLLKTLPLTDGRDRPFRFGMPDPVLAQLHRIDSDASGQIEMGDEIASPTTRDRYIVSSLMEEAITSSQLEGASTTRRVAKEMLRSGRQPRNDHERMIVNNYHAMAWVRDRTDTDMTPEMLLELHGVITSDTLASRADERRLRRDDEDVYVTNAVGEILHTPPPAGTLPRRLDRLCAFANASTSDSGFVHPVVRAIILHFWLAFDHPFVDGNGRTARALFYWSVLRQKYWLFEFISISRVIKTAPAKYAQAFLFAETDENDATYFVVHQLDALRKATENLKKYIAKTLRERHESHELLRDCDLNHRQIGVIQHALRHPLQEYTIKSHQNSYRVAYQTARTDLMDLEGRGLLLGRRVGRRFVWRPTNDLRSALDDAFG
jgi:Fic family protein